MAVHCYHTPYITRFTSPQGFPRLVLCSHSLPPPFLEDPLFSSSYFFLFFIQLHRSLIVKLLLIFINFFIKIVYAFVI